MKKSFIMRLLCTLLAVLMLLSVGLLTVGCADNSDTGKGNKPVTPSGDKTYKANIPEGVDYTGEEFVVYTYPTEGVNIVWQDFDWHNEGMNGDPISEAVYQRNEQVMEELGFEIVPEYGKHFDPPDDLTHAIRTGDDIYDIANVTVKAHVTMIENGDIFEINSFGGNASIDLTAPWWDQNLLEGMSIYDKNFCLAGDIGTTYKRSISAILFNKKLHFENGFENLYTMVEGKYWTFENMADMAEAISAELGGNGEWGDDDLYGLVYFSGIIGATVIACDVKCATKDSLGKPVMSLEKGCAKVFNMIKPFYYDQQISYNVYAHRQSEAKMWEMFQANHALFYYGELHSAEDLRGMETDFGILPMPLANEDQENYRHSINPNVAAVIVIPETNTNYTMTCHALDALGAASKNILTPAYYDKNLEDKVSRDDESEASLKTIFSTIVYDPGFLFTAETNNMLRGLCEAYSIDFASEYGAKGSLMQGAIDNLCDKVLELYD